MQFFISFLEGIITFVSPCLLPMLPIYISYFAGDSERDTKRVVKNALGFILGFTLVFVLLGALAGSLGTLLQEYSAVVNLVTGLIVIFFGLNFLGVFRVNLFRGTKLGNVEHLGFFSSLLFGVVFSVGWTPCVGAFLGSALLLYSLGLGVPFFISAVLIDRLKGAFSFIKRHYRVINLVSGGFLVAIGVLMATGLFGKFLALLS